MTAKVLMRLERDSGYGVCLRQKELGSIFWCCPQLWKCCQSVKTLGLGSMWRKEYCRGHYSALSCLGMRCWW